MQTKMIKTLIAVVLLLSMFSAQYSEFEYIVNTTINNFNLFHVAALIAFYRLIR